MRSLNHRKFTTVLVSGLTMAMVGMSCSYPSKAQSLVSQLPTSPNSSGGGNLVQPSGTYTLGGGDNIRIDIFELPQYSGEYQIPAGGQIQLPLIGSVSVQGLTLEEAADRISAAYQPVLKRPLITVSLLATRPLNVLISGEVNRPGSYALQLTSGGGTRPSVQFPTLLQALQQAQGVTLAADITSIQLRRQTGRGPDETYNFNLQEFLQTGRLSADVTLRDGDTIFVPTTTQANLQDVRLLTDATFGTSPELPRSVSVIGEVNRPGNYVVIGGDTTVDIRNAGLPTVTRALQLAGGIRPQADIRQIQIRRITRTGGEQIFNVNLWQLLKSGDFSQDTVLQEGDTVIVPTATEINPAEIPDLANASFSPTVIRVSVIGEVKRPGLVEVPPDTTLNQALLVAGGFNDSRAYRQSIELIRLNFDGTISRRQIPVDLSQNINEQTNPLLRPDDIIVVDRSGIARTADNINTALNPAANILATISIPSRVLELLDLLGILNLN